jgi:hypothetical protein
VSISQHPLSLVHRTYIPWWWSAYSHADMTCPYLSVRFHNHHPLIGSHAAFEIKKIKKLCLKFVLIGGEGEFRVWEFFNNSQGNKRKSHSKQIPLSIIDVCLVWVLRNFDLMFWGKTRSEWNFSIVIEFFDGDD